MTVGSKFFVFKKSVSAMKCLVVIQEYRTKLEDQQTNTTSYALYARKIK